MKTYTDQMPRSQLSMIVAPRGLSYTDVQETDSTFRNRRFNGAQYLGNNSHYGNVLATAWSFLIPGLLIFLQNSTKANHHSVQNKCIESLKAASSITGWEGSVVVFQDRERSMMRLLVVGFGASLQAPGKERGGISLVSTMGHPFNSVTCIQKGITECTDSIVGRSPDF